MPCTDRATGEHRAAPRGSGRISVAGHPPITEQVTATVDPRQGDRDLRSAILGPAQGACGAALSVWVASIADIQRGEKVDADLRLRARSARRSKVDPRGVR